MQPVPPVRREQEQLGCWDASATPVCTISGVVKSKPRGNRSATALPKADNGHARTAAGLSAGMRQPFGMTCACGLWMPLDLERARSGRLQDIIATPRQSALAGATNHRHRNVVGVRNLCHEPSFYIVCVVATMLPRSDPVLLATSMAANIKPMLCARLTLAVRTNAASCATARLRFALW